MREHPYRPNRLTSLPWTCPQPQFWLLLVFLYLTGGQAAAAMGLQESPGGLSGSEHASIVAPEEWANRLLAQCLDRREQWAEKLSLLERELRNTAQSVEDSEFAEKERSAHEKALKSDRDRVFARLNFLMAGDRAPLKNPAETFRRAASLKRPEGKDAFLRTLQLLFGDATACDLKALQVTLLFAYYGVSFTEEHLEQALRDDDILEVLEHSFHHQAPNDGERTPETAYLALRESVADDAHEYVDALMVRLAGIASSQVAMARSQTPYTDDAAQEQLKQDVRSALEDLDDNPLRDRFSEGQEELRGLVRQMQAYSRRAAEPARLRIYIHAKVEQIEGALRTNVPDKEFDKLQTQVEKALFADHRALVRLTAQPPDGVLATLSPIIENWFQRRALPAIGKRFYDDPFSAYWFFVQTGGAARLTRPYKDSEFELTDVAFSIENLRGRGVSEVLTHLRKARIPERFLDEHEELESALTEVTLSREAALETLATVNLPDGAKRRLEQYIKDPLESDVISTIDIYRWVIRDANKVQGSVNWGLVGSALRLLHSAKQKRLQNYIQEVRAQQREEGERLAAYLLNAGNMMLELELRQATEWKFKEGMGGAFVGWILSRFFVSSGVPVQLWVPNGVTGPEFFELMNELTPKNRESENRYSAKSATGISLVHDGREYHDAVLRIIDAARNFVNISAFDWKRDKGGREIAYRLMAKKLGIAGASFDDLVASFPNGIRSSPESDTLTLFYDVPAPRMKNLLIYHFFRTSQHPDVVSIRSELERLLDGKLECTSLKLCGDLSLLHERAGERYRTERAQDPAYRSAWEAYQRLQALFGQHSPSMKETRPRHSLSEYVSDADRLRRFVRRYGLMRADNPGRPLPMNIIVDGKQTMVFNSSLGPNRELPFLLQHPVSELYGPLMEFDAKLVLWKGLVEFPWHIGPLPIPGRKIAGVIPMPFIPYPWLNAIPGFGWAGTASSILLQYLLASDPRNLWGRVTHTKHLSNESMALESGMGFGSKYFNEHEDFQTWHDMGVAVEGPIVDDLNDHFVQVFNQARVNNSGVPGSKGIRVDKLKYADYRSKFALAPSGSGAKPVNPSWVVTTHPEEGDFNYRAVFMAGLAAAKRNIYLETSFFADPLVSRMLVRKAREFRGRVSCQQLDEQQCSERKKEAVSIHVVLPGGSDKPIIDAIGAADFHEMLHLGIKIYRWAPREGWSSSKMLHTKAWMVDYEPKRGALTYVGSSNATQRSHIQDNEVGIVSFSAAFADEVYQRLFEPDLTEDSRVENAENFHIVLSTNPAIRASRRVRRFLVSLLWII